MFATVCNDKKVQTKCSVLNKAAKHPLRKPTTTVTISKAWDDSSRKPKQTNRRPSLAMLNKIRGPASEQESKPMRVAETAPKEAKYWAPGIA